MKTDLLNEDLLPLVQLFIPNAAFKEVPDDVKVIEMFPGLNMDYESEQIQVQGKQRKVWKTVYPKMIAAKTGKNNPRFKGGPKKDRKHNSLYSTWASMKQRCSNPKTRSYKDYGGRGISVAKEFLPFKAFHDYVITLPDYELREEKNLSIDRINNNGNYERGNLRWASKSEQQLNSRKSNLNYHFSK